MNIVSMLHNQATNRYHPILFGYSPPPSGDLDSGARRYRSRGHHTAGFDTRDEALNGAEELAEKAAPAECATGGDIAWDGEGVPAMTLWFGKLDGVLQPLF